ncbi:MAG: PEP-CTERM sorting domain-containing protein [Candidatus Tectimicrobiota bacterium]
MQYGWKKQLLTYAGVCALLFAAPMASEAVSITNTTYGTADASVFERMFEVSGVGERITDVDILINFSKCDDPAPGPGDANCLGGDFSFNREIDLLLTSPSGTAVSLVIEDTYDGQTPGARVVVTFDDEATTPVGGSRLQSGSFQPVSLLSAFDGEDPNGIWTLRVTDTVGADPLQFYCGVLGINEAPTSTDAACTTVSSAVPEPSTYAMFLTGLGALFAYARRRRWQR